MTAIPDDMSELVNADIPRVDLVGKAANGTKFFLMKGAEEASNMFSPADVRALLKEADTDVTTPLAGDDGLNAAIPGSPEWETVDAASAQKWIGILARAKNAVETLAERETMESAVADGDDIENAWNLEDACYSIDAAIRILAVYAAGEQAEVDLAGDAAGITKAAAAIDTTALGTVEAIAAITKAGRALSASNEAALRGAADAIQKVLASLPAAPEEAPLILKEAPVAESTDRIASIEAQMGYTAPADVTKAEEPAPAPAEAADVAKADNLLAVYDNKGNLIGVVDPGSLTVVDGGESVVEESEDDTDGDAVDAVDEASPVAAESDPSADEAVIPGTNTIQSPVEDDPEHVTKAATDIAALLKEALAPLAEQVAKAADLAGQVEVLKEQVAAYGREPDDRKSPYLNGATGTAGIAKRDGTETDPHAELRKAAEAATTQDERISAQKSLALAILKGTVNPDERYRNTLDRFAN